jgi:predicted 2-oxoglutarate/Fe(II)-dependent dioxygenase YbiX
MSLELIDYIKVFDVTLPENFLEMITQQYPEMEPARVVNNILDTKSRKCYQKFISSNLDNEEKQIIDKTVFHIVGDVLKRYVSQCPFCPATLDSGYMLLRYNEGDFYKEHVDNGASKDRILTIIIALNDNYEGGEISFFQGRHKIRLKKHQAIAFPSSFVYPHQIHEITKGTRFSIVTWMK